jgi:hypothetical protein
LRRSIETTGTATKVQRVVCKQISPAQRTNGLESLKFHFVGGLTFGGGGHHVHQSPSTMAAPMPAPRIAASINNEVGGTVVPREGRLGAVEAVAAWLK